MKYTLRIIEESICGISNVSMELLCSKKKSVLLNSLRGIYYLLAIDNGIHPTVVGERLCRSRCNVINQAKRYKGYLDIKDKFITELYTLILRKIETQYE